MSATDGQTLLDTNGKCILRDDGTKELSDGAGDDCCCGLECFQLWTATYDCETEEWTLTQGEKDCKPAGTPTDWFGSECIWMKWVDIGHTCAVDGDCYDYPDTSPPDLPFGGFAPPSCCPPPLPCEACSEAPLILPTSRVWTVTFDGVDTSLFKCAGECFGGGETTDGAALTTYDLEQDAMDACLWVWEGTGPEIDLFGDDSTCSNPPTVTDNRLRITLRANIDHSFSLKAFNPYLFITFFFFQSENDPLDDPYCCASKTFTNIVTVNGCGQPGAGGTALATPHC